LENRAEIKTREWVNWEEGGNERRGRGRYGMGEGGVFKAF